LLVLANVSFGLASGSYDFLLPFYMESKQISFGDMGVIFSIAGLAMVLGRVFVGRHSDRVGRKPYYLASLGGMSLACFSAPFFARPLPLAFSKTTAEVSKELRFTIQSIAVFDHVGDKFLKFIGKAAGPVFIFEGLGVILAGFLLKWWGFQWVFIFLGVQLLLTNIVFASRFEEGAPRVEKKQKQDSLFSHKMPNELWLIAISGFLLVTGMSASHCFVMPLFFKDKFGLSPEMVALILAAHRIALGLPMLTSGMTWGMSQKTVWLVFSTVQSVTMFLTGVVPGVLWAAATWWAHDLIGGGIWDPVRQHYIQHYCRDGKRGHDLGRVTAISACGWIFGPLIAGYLYPISPSAPFIASGIMKHNHLRYTGKGKPV